MLLGPETAAMVSPIPEDAEFFGIEFCLGPTCRAFPSLTWPIGYLLGLK